jgi:hypothetical protein
MTNNQARNIANWTPVLFCDDNLLPAGRGYEAWLDNGQCLTELRIIEDNGVIEGYMDRIKVCEAGDTGSCAEFLIDYAESPVQIGPLDC